MAGHSKFKNIMHRKGKQDAVRAKMFTKIAREITSAAKQGSPDPAMNPRLRLAVQNARSQSMPKDRIERAIQQAAAAGGDDYKNVRYEGFGPGGVGIIVETLTDNLNRTAGNLRSYFAKMGGNLGTTNSVTSGFDRVGEIRFAATVASEEPKQVQSALPKRPRFEESHRRRTIYLENKLDYKVQDICASHPTHRSMTGLIYAALTEYIQTHQL